MDTYFSKEVIEQLSQIRDRQIKEGRFVDSPEPYISQHLDQEVNKFIKETYDSMVNIKVEDWSQDMTNKVCAGIWYRQVIASQQELHLQPIFTDQGLERIAEATQEAQQEAEQINNAYRENHEGFVFPIINDNSSHESMPSLLAASSSSEEDYTKNYQEIDPDYDHATFPSWPNHTPWSSASPPPTRNKHLNKKCWKCQQYGHLRLDCPKLASRRLHSTKKPLHLKKEYNMNADFKYRARRSAGKLPSQGEMAKRQLLSYIRGHLMTAQSATDYMHQRLHFWGGAYKYINEAKVEDIEAEIGDIITNSE